MIGQVNAAVEWLVGVFNQVWPLALATFIGAWLAFQHHKNDEKRAERKAKRGAVRHVHLVLSNQDGCLKRLKSTLGKKGQRSCLANGTPLDMVALLAAFDDEPGLVDEILQAEHRYRELVILAGNPARHGAAKGAGLVPDEELKGMVDEALAGFAEVLPKVDSYLERFCPKPRSETIDYMAWYALAGALSICGVFFFSNWAVNGEAVRAGLNMDLVSALVFAVSLYVSIALCCVVAVMTVYTTVKRLGSFGVYFWALLVSIQPLVYLLWLDAQ